MTSIWSTTYLAWTDGSTVTAGRLAAIAGVGRVRGGDQTFTVATAERVDTLAVPVVAGATYRYRLVVAAWETSGTSGDVLVAVQTPTGATLHATTARAPATGISSATGTTLNMAANPTGTSMGTITTASGGVWSGVITMGVISGWIRVTGRQATDTATTAYIGAGSALTVVRIA